MTDTPGKKLSTVGKPAVALDADQKELVADIRALLDRALDGSLKSLFGVAEFLTTELDDGEKIEVEDFEQVSIGTAQNVDAIYRRLTQVVVVVDNLDGKSWSPALPEDDDDAPE